MEARARLAFLLLVIAQAAHSIEEFAFRLYDVFAPARAVSSLVGGLLGIDPLLGNDRVGGFVIVNAGFVAFGAWCWLARVRVGHPSARAWVWPWVAIELGNGAGHLAIAAAVGSYYPGAATAPLLLGLAAFLAWRLSRAEPGPTRGRVPG